MACASVVTVYCTLICLRRSCAAISHDDRGSTKVILDFIVAQLYK